MNNITKQTDNVDEKILRRRESQRKYRLANKDDQREKSRLYSKKYYNENRDKMKLINKEYYEKSDFKKNYNKEYAKRTNYKSQKQYIEANRDKVDAHIKKKYVMGRINFLAEKWKEGHPIMLSIRPSAVKDDEYYAIRKQRAKEWQIQNKDSVKGYSRKHYQNNIEAERIKSKVYYNENKDKMKEYQAKYRDENKEKIKAYRDKYKLDKAKSTLESKIEKLKNKLDELNNNSISK